MQTDLAAKPSALRALFLELAFLAVPVLRCSKRSESEFLCMLANQTLCPSPAEPLQDHLSVIGTKAFLLADLHFCMSAQLWRCRSLP